MMDKLLPCPFCGGENTYIDGYEHRAGLRWRVVCLDCMGMVDPGTIQQKYRAVSAWNRRTGKDINVATNNAVPVVRGEWRFRSNGHNITRSGDYEEWHECSACKLSAEYPSSYCPNCGAKMESEGGT